MSIPHAGPGAPVDLRPESETLTEAKTLALIKDDAFEAIRMVVPKEHEVCHEHYMKGPITVQCLEGWVALSIDGDKHSLKTGQWTFVPAGAPHTITGVDNSLVLLTIIFR
jgi:quercetin dioxygenase-like cupin family protein